MAGKVENMFLATAMDTHDPGSPLGAIHPRDKQTVAQRLAWAALHSVYRWGNINCTLGGRKFLVKSGMKKGWG